MKEMSNIADISPLIGRHFVSSALNVGRVIKLDSGAARVRWQTSPSPDDIQEFSKWAEDVLGPLNITLHTDIRTEPQALAKWKRRSGRE